MAAITADGDNEGLSVPVPAAWVRLLLGDSTIRAADLEWSRAILRESPWYSEIVKEGLEEGLQQGLRQGRLEERAEVLMRIIERRFGTVPPELTLRLRVLGAEQLYQLVDVALTAATLDMVMATLNSLPPDPHSGDLYLRRYDVKGSRG